MSDEFLESCRWHKRFGITVHRVRGSQNEYDETPSFIQTSRRLQRQPHWLRNWKSKIDVTAHDYEYTPLFWITGSLIPTTTSFRSRRWNRPISRPTTVSNALLATVMLYLVNLLSLALNWWYKGKAIVADDVHADLMTPHNYGFPTWRSSTLLDEPSRSPIVGLWSDRVESVYTDRDSKGNLFWREVHHPEVHRIVMEANDAERERPYWWTDREKLLRCSWKSSLSLDKRPENKLLLTTTDLGRFQIYSYRNGQCRNIQTGRRIPNGEVYAWLTLPHWVTNCLQQHPEVDDVEDSVATEMTEPTNAHKYTGASS